jgi:hypothetical protein
MVELETASSGHALPKASWPAWLDTVAEWKAGLKTTPGISASGLVIEDRRARR